ncbi:MAG: DUF3105 domain-containing protein [Chloroflexi bacterium]|nr:DUF3105 domain-containing protein [Chloroflexota bacterium]
MDRKSPAGGAAPAGGPPSRRTPVKVSGGGGFPTVPVGIAAGVLIVVGLIVYLIIQSNSSDTGLSGPEKAAADTSSSIPGTYVPDQGRGHFTGGYTSSRPPTPFCEGVAWSGADTAAVAATPTAQATTADATASDGAPEGTPTVPTNCYNSNPPSSGKHLNVQRNVDVGNGNIIKIPPDPDVYPRDVDIPRDAIAHALEHAGVFLGYNCKQGDTACDDVITQIEDLANARIDRGDRVSMAHDSDLVEGTIGLSSWTRVYVFKYEDYDKGEVQRFMEKNSCRYDPEGFCR